MAEINLLALNNVRAFLKKLDQSEIHISQAFIFGSYAANQEDEWSDIDVAVVSPQIGDDRFEERVRLTKIALNIDDRIEPLPYNVNKFNEQDPLVREIMSKGIPVMPEA